MKRSQVSCGVGGKRGGGVVLLGAGPRWTLGHETSGEPDNEDCPVGQLLGLATAVDLSHAVDCGCDMRASWSARLFLLGMGDL